MSTRTNVSRQVSSLQDKSDLRRAEVLTSLRLLGADEYDLLLPETHYLPRILQPNEVLFGVVYGRYKKIAEKLVGRGLLAITNQRVIMVDKKPLYEQTDDIKFDVVSGVDFSEAGPAATVALHTRMGDIHFRTFNKRCGRQFVQAVQDMLYENQQGYHDDYYY